MARIPMRSRLCSLVVAGTLALSMCPAAQALADDTVEAMDVSTYVTASNSPASQAAPEILGISGVDELQSFPKDLYTDLTGNAGLKYLLMGTTEYNENPNPYFYNYVYNTTGVKVVDNTDKRRSSSNFVNEMGMPVRALAPFQQGDATDDAVWLTKPDIIIGNVIDKAGTQVTYNEEEYAPAVTKYLGESEGSYKPTASTYTLNSMADIVAKTYELAENGEAAAASTGKSLRYGDATDIAENYEKYIKGTQGYILEQLELSKAQKKTVAVVEKQTEDGNYVITATPKSFKTSTRFLEITTLVANNLADSQTANSEGVIAVTKDTLAQADLIILTTGASKADMGDLAVKTYWANSNNTGAIYKVDANSVEIGTNYGRILGCLYPEYVDQSDWVAYYYDTFYHVKDAKLSEAIDMGMDGVRNWNVQSGDASALLNWTTSDVADYTKYDVQSKLDDGVAYIDSLGEEANELIKLTDYLSGKFSSFEDVAEGAWYHAAVNYVAGEKLMNGISADTFGVGQTITRAQMAMILYRYSNVNPDESLVANTTGISDVESNQWYTCAVNWAVANGVINGYKDDSGKVVAFGPNDAVSIEQFATIMKNTLGKTAAVDQSVLNNYSDAAQIAEWAKEGVAWAIDYGMISGYGDGKIGIGDQLNRERVATLFYKAAVNELM